jgi:DNA polymerase-1
LLLQVHDELILEVAKGEEAILTQLVKDGMGSAFKLSVPLDVNIGIGTSWDLAAH